MCVHTSSVSLSFTNKFKRTFPSVFLVQDKTTETKQKGVIGVRQDTKKGKPKTKPRNNNTKLRPFFFLRIILFTTNILIYIYTFLIFLFLFFSF